MMYSKCSWWRYWISIDAFVGKCGFKESICNHMNCRSCRDEDNYPPKAKDYRKMDWRKKNKERSSRTVQKLDWHANGSERHLPEWWSCHFHFNGIQHWELSFSIIYAGLMRDPMIVSNILSVLPYIILKNSSPVEGTTRKWLSHRCLLQGICVSNAHSTLTVLLNVIEKIATTRRVETQNCNWMALLCVHFTVLYLLVCFLIITHK